MRAVVGNPPYIRFQCFCGEVRDRALSQARRQGVELSGSSSAWSPFLVHSIGMLEDGGRLAMVLPAELGYARYARPIWRHLGRVFASVRILTFKTKLFPKLSEDTLILLAANKGGGPARFEIVELSGPSDLAKIDLNVSMDGVEVKVLDGERIATGEGRLAEYLLPAATRELYRELEACGAARRLETMADVDIGYVTGGNDFFHVTETRAAAAGIPSEFLRRSIFRLRGGRGLQFTGGDWEAAAAKGDAGYLIFVDSSDSSLPKTLRDYLDMGVQSGVSRRYKPRVRKPWFRVPGVCEPPAFLTYMNSRTPVMVANTMHAVIPNNFLTVHPLSSETDSEMLSALWRTSLVGVSCELEGHALGAGVLKLEPGEARRVLVPNIAGVCPGDIIDEIDSLVRRGMDAAATEKADHFFLRRSLGLSVRDCRKLKEGGEMLRSRRTGR